MFVTVGKSCSIYVWGASAGSGTEGTIEFIAETGNVFIIEDAARFAGTFAEFTIPASYMIQANLPASVTLKIDGVSKRTEGLVPIGLIPDPDPTENPTGPMGPQGPAGKSAYEVAVDNGFAGTEEDWLLSLIGPQGPPGSGGGDVISVNDQTGIVVLSAADVGARPDTWTPTWNEVTGKPATFPASTHDHDDRYLTETEVNTALAGKSDTSHNHDSRYYTETEVDTALSGKANTSHTHTKAQITDLVEYTVPTQAEAEAGTATDPRVWTAERVKQAILALAPEQATGGVQSVNGDNGPDVTLTPEDIGAAPTVHTHPVGEITGISTVSQAEAEAGTSTIVRWWTAQRVAQAIAAQVTAAMPIVSQPDAPDASGLDDGTLIVVYES